MCFTPLQEPSLYRVRHPWVGFSPASPRWRALTPACSITRQSAAWEMRSVKLAAIPSRYSSQHPIRCSLTFSRALRCASLTARRCESMPRSPTHGATNTSTSKPARVSGPIARNAGLKATNLSSLPTRIGRKEPPASSELCSSESHFPQIVLSS